MTDKLPPNLLKLFAPRPPLQYFTPLDREPSLKQGPTISGIGAFVPFLKDHDPDYVPSETVEERRKRKAQERKNKSEEAIREGLAKWNPAEDPQIESDPFRTLFIGRLSYDTTERDLRDEMEIYGPITKVSIPVDKVTNKPRGYAFLEFEREKDMKSAYKYADGIKIMGRRVVVDVERGRSVKGWRPRRLGGGLGGTRIGGPKQNQRSSGREGAVEKERERERERDGSGYGNRGYDRGPRDYGGGRDGRDRPRNDYNRDYDRKRRRSRSRSPRGYRDRDRGGRDRGSGRDRGGGGGSAGGRDRDRYRDRDGGRERSRERYRR
ncbi:hypothetical protein K7432_007821 [Basidiobolus ranarum]|uniref:RRM domain-containing protein n=1 Tax=Basidiobolus ranarum TaxID=34480 RepID=A0ABR2VZJ2_9FUNG